MYPWIGGSGWQFCAGYSLCVSVGSIGTTSVFSGSGSGCWTMFAYPAGDFEESVRRATLFRLILQPPASNTYDPGNVCLAYCSSTVAAFHSFDSCSGFTLK